MKKSSILKGYQMVAPAKKQRKNRGTLKLRTLSPNQRFYYLSEQRKNKGEC